MQPRSHVSPNFGSAGLPAIPTPPETKANPNIHPSIQCVHTMLGIRKMTVGNEAATLKLNDKKNSEKKVVFDWVTLEDWGTQQLGRSFFFLLTRRKGRGRIKVGR